MTDSMLERNIAFQIAEHLRHDFGWSPMIKAFQTPEALRRTAASAAY